ncbi:hypothetical protein [Alicyclobacillus macrosporangiidus]|uniref:hypothetical protein n=1 Tax=Alicyclobacillus macrosporangiidus TaxID=392015 RepID=UPI0026EF52F0|nr:hypothetical protein [Alicyclobacillus macrosporangiidus]
MNVVPRLENVELEIERQSKRQDNLESAITALRRDLIDTEARLSKKVDERFDKVDKHLSEQDARLDRLVDSKRNWPQGAIIAMTAVATLFVGIAVAEVTHILKF